MLENVIHFTKSHIVWALECRCGLDKSPGSRKVLSWSQPRSCPWCWTQEIRGRRKIKVVSSGFPPITPCDECAAWDAQSHLQSKFIYIRYQRPTFSCLGAETPFLWSLNSVYNDYILKTDNISQTLSLSAIEYRSSGSTQTAVKYKITSMVML